jgi:hypothetical protein
LVSQFLDFYIIGYGIYKLNSETKLENSLEWNRADGNPSAHQLPSPARGGRAQGRPNWPARAWLRNFWRTNPALLQNRATTTPTIPIVSVHAERPPVVTVLHNREVPSVPCARRRCSGQSSARSPAAGAGLRPTDKPTSTTERKHHLSRRKKATQRLLLCCSRWRLIHRDGASVPAS